MIATIVCVMVSCMVLLIVFVWMMTTYLYVNPWNSLMVSMGELFPLPFPFQIRSAFSACALTTYRVFGESAEIDTPVNLDLFKERLFRVGLRTFHRKPRWKRTSRVIYVCVGPCEFGLHYDRPKIVQYNSPIAVYLVNLWDHSRGQRRSFVLWSFIPFRNWKWFYFSRSSAASLIVVAIMSLSRLKYFATQVDFPQPGTALTHYISGVCMLLI